MSHEFNQAAAPVVIIPFVWIGDFVRCHSVVKLLRAQNPDRAVDIVSSTLCAPLADYMPGIRRTIVADLPRRRLGVARQRQLADQLHEGKYGQALVMSRKWKAALAPWLAGIPVRTGFAGEFRFGLLNDIRFGELRLPRMIDQMGALALPKDLPLPAEWPLPELKVPAHDVQTWLARQRLAGKRADRYAVPGCGRCRKSMAGCALRRIGKGTHNGRRIRLDSRRTVGNFTGEKNHCGGRRSRARSHRIGLAQRNSGVGRG
jgi:heptosyltransferase-2